MPIERKCAVLRYATDRQLELYITAGWHIVDCNKQFEWWASFLVGSYCECTHPFHVDGERRPAIG